MTSASRPRSAAKLPPVATPRSALAGDAWSRTAAVPARPRLRPREMEDTGTRTMTRPAREVAAGGRVVKGPVRERHEPDYALMIAIVALAAVGVLMVYSSSAAHLRPDGTGNPFSSVMDDLRMLGAGIVAMLVLSRMDYRRLRLFSVPGAIIGLALLVVVMLPAIGPIRPLETGGARRWLDIGGLFQIHPAEIAKLAMIVYLAHWFARRGGTVSSFTRGTLPFLAIAGMFIVLVAVEPDLGTTTVFALTGFTIFFVAGANLRHLVLMVPMGVAAVALYIGGRDYQLGRITTFLDPWANKSADGYHTVQGLYALAMGGIFGSGLGQSRQPGGLNLPNAENDFVFAMVGQELGLMGGVLVIGLFLFVAWRGVRIALRSPDTFGALLAVGITAALALQAFINIGVVVNLLPVTGITLPFVSSGGTSLVVSFAAVGILLSISRESTTGGSWNDADPGRGGRNGRPSVPGAGGPAVARPASR